MISLPRTKIGAGHHATSAGFTLVELLVGLSLLALLSVLLFGGFRFGLRAWESGDRQIHQIGEVERAQNLLRTLLSEAQPPAAIVENGDVRLIASFIGTETGVSFVAPLPAHRGAGGLYEFRLSLDRSAAADSLVLSWRPYRPERALGRDADFVDSSVLMAAVDGVGFQYYRSADEDGPASWQPTWSGARGLPKLIRLEVGQVARRDNVWPELLAAPKLQ